MKKYFLLLLIPVVFVACTSTQILDTINTVNTVANSTGGGKGLTSGEIGKGLKEALSVGIRKGAENVSKTDGYFKNPLIKILFPPEVAKVETRLRQLGAGNLVDNAVMKINRAAEGAAKEAIPIFVNAITQMTITDAMNILKGKDNAATDFLKRTTYNQLYTKFNPSIKKSLNKVGATDIWSQAITKYNQIPLVDDVNPDLNDYVTKKALDGLFLKVSEEEKNIRKNPLARTTSLLKKVFGSKEAQG